jgi:hypothetical protein
VLRPPDDEGGPPSRRAWIGAALVLVLVVGATASTSAVARRASAGSLAVLALAAGAAVVAGPLAHAAVAGALAVDLVLLGVAMHAGIDPAAVARVRRELADAREALAADGAGASLDRVLAVPTLVGAGWASLEHVRLLQGWNVLVPRTASRLLGTVAPGDYEFGLVRDPALFSAADQALDLLRCGLVLVPVAPFRDPAWAAAFDGSRWQPVRETAGWRMLANRRVRPVGWMVHHLRTVTTDDAVAIVHGRRGAFDPATEALASATDVPALDPAPPSAEPVRLIAYDDDALALEVEAASRGLLVTSELAYPGWTATVDGTPAPLLEVDAGLRAVVVPAGSHAVVFTYRPRLARLGMALGAAAALGLAAAVVVARRP